MDRAWGAIQALLLAAANISKLVGGTKGATYGERQRFANFCGLPERPR
jgi:hypothetical protein